MTMQRAVLGFAAVLSLAVLLAGCPSKSGGGSSGAGNVGKGETSGGQNAPIAAKMGGPSGTQETELPLDRVPADLRHEAFEYYGLGAGKEVEFKVVASNRSEPMTGGMSISLAEVKDAEAKFRVTYSGALAPQGRQELVLKKDGIYVVRIADNALPAPILELPAQLTPGKTWKTAVSIDLPSGQKAEIERRFKIIGPAKVKVQAGEFSAIKIQGTGTTVVDADRYSSTVTGWYVKGRGAVKVVDDSKKPDGTKLTVTIEAVK